MFAFGLEGHLVTQLCRRKCKTLFVIIIFFLVELNDLATLKHALGGLLLFPQVVCQKF